jgi:carboxymethylenebutenolidase
MSTVSQTTIESRHDGFSLAALRAKPDGAGRGSVVVIQEIFGLSAHIAELCSFFADAGYETLAPSLFDRIEPHFSAGHDPDGFAKGIAAVQATPWEQVVGDVRSAIDLLPRPVFVTGYCYGGTVAWVAAARCGGVAAASCFYGRLIRNFLGERLAAPVQLHYGARDASIPAEDIEAVRRAHPEADVHVYDAGHAFCRRGGPAYDEASAALALKRTLDWFARASG